MRKVGIVACSNGLNKSKESDLKLLEKVLLEMGFESVYSDCIYAKQGVFSETAKERAKSLMNLYQEEDIEHIFDVSGGDLANGILSFLDYDIIRMSEKVFWGYSDLTTVLNAIYTKTQNKSVLYQIRNLVSDKKEEQILNFGNTLIKGGRCLFQIDYHFVQGKEMKGIVIGGNIRCFLKLAGTEYMPDFEGKILLLESFSGSVAKMETYLCQIYQLGVFDKVAGILLGTFTEMEREKCIPTIEMLVKGIVGSDMPIAKTRDIGHGTDVKGIVIGETYHFVNIEGKVEKVWESI